MKHVHTDLWCPECVQHGRDLAKAEAEGRIRKILKGTRWLTQLRRTLGIQR